MKVGWNTLEFNLEEGMGDLMMWCIHCKRKGAEERDGEEMGSCVCVFGEAGGCQLAGTRGDEWAQISAENEGREMERGF